MGGVARVGNVSLHTSAWSVSSPGPILAVSTSADEADNAFTA